MNQGGEMKRRMFNLALVGALCAGSAAFAQAAQAQTSGCPVGQTCSTVPIQPPLNNNRGSTFDLPTLNGRGVFISQIGEAHTASVDQSERGGDAYASVVQVGAGHRTTVDQRGFGAKYASVVQAGSDQVAEITQDGEAAATLVLAQGGSGNVARVDQTATGAGNAAVLVQTGMANRITLLQTGGGNDALLTQVGDDNTMNLAQTGVDNRATWTQIGSDLGRGLRIEQDGVGMRTNIVQTGAGG
jgi:hypothetical protein